MSVIKRAHPSDCARGLIVAHVYDVLHLDRRSLHHACKRSRVESNVLHELVRRVQMHETRSRENVHRNYGNAPVRCRRYETAPSGRSSTRQRSRLGRQRNAFKGRRPSGCRVRPDCSLGEQDGALRTGPIVQQRARRRNPLVHERAP